MDCTKKQKAFKANNNFENIMTSLVTTGARIGKLMEVTNEAIKSNNPDGKAISKMEKEKIYKAIKDVE
jgi:hypothetical protein